MKPLNDDQEKPESFEISQNGEAVSERLSTEDCAVHESQKTQQPHEKFNVPCMTSPMETPMTAKPYFRSTMTYQYN